MPRPPHRRLLSVALALAAIADLTGPAAHAFVRVHLQNGFSYDCARQELLDPTHVRLFFADQPDTATANFLDLPASAIASVETLPDPPRASPAGSPSAAPDVHTLLLHAGAAHDIDVELLASVIHAESGGHAGAVSHAGALGLMQLMPSTAHSLGVQDALAADQNVSGGTAYLDALLTRYHENLALALAAYNAGPAAVDRYHGVPPFRETRAYVIRVMTEFKRRKFALSQAERASR